MGRIIKFILVLGGLLLLAGFVASHFIEEDDYSWQAPTIPPFKIPSSFPTIEIPREIPRDLLDQLLGRTPTPTPQMTPLPSSVIQSVTCKEIEIEKDGVTYVEVGADGEPIEICNHIKATDPTWSELISFLRRDTTDQIPYQDYEFVCSDYAEMLHNNAEAAGIKAAWVGVDFYGEEVGHAVNAFNVTDKGLVYIQAINVEDLDCPSDCVVTLAQNDCIQYDLLFCPDWELTHESKLVNQIYIIW